MQAVQLYSTAAHTDMAGPACANASTGGPMWEGHGSRALGGHMAALLRG